MRKSVRLGRVVVLSIEGLKKQTEWARKVIDVTDDRMMKRVFVENVPGKQPREDQAKDGPLI